jgi:hypothetical protein
VWIANDSLNEIPNLDSVYKDMQVFNESLHSLPNLTYYVVGMQTLAGYVPIPGMSTYLPSVFLVQSMHMDYN